jgi:CheY-like chemotaxis protein
MDIQLPIMDGYTATRLIKGDPALKYIPIIAVTSYALDGEEKKARAAGCDDYVPKPYSPRHLLARSGSTCPNRAQSIYCDAVRRLMAQRRRLTLDDRCLPLSDKQTLS